MEEKPVPPPLPPSPLPEITPGKAMYAVTAKSVQNLESRMWVVPVVLFILVLSVTAAAWLGHQLQGQLKPNFETSYPNESIFRPKAKAVYVEGEVTGNGIKLTEGDIVEEGAVIKSKSGARAVLLFDEGSIVRVGENSSITLSKLTTQEMAINEEVGVLYARVNKSQEHKFLVTAGGVTIESAGTAFMVEYQSGVKVSVYESEVTVTSQGNAEVKVAKDQQWTTGSSETSLIDPKDIKENQFVQWNLKEDKLTN